MSDLEFDTYFPVYGRFLVYSAYREGHSLRVLTCRASLVGYLREHEAQVTFNGGERECGGGWRVATPEPVTTTLPVCKQGGENHPCAL